MKKYLRCFSDNGRLDLTVGKRYEIVDIDDFIGADCYVIIDDASDRSYWPIETDYEGESYRDWFTLETDEDTAPIDGRKAEITRPGKRFDTYVDFAVKHGYPDSAYDYRKGGGDTRKPPQKGDTVTLLVSGEHDSMYKGDTLWIVEAANGDRHIFNEKGLRIIDATPDGITASAPNGTTLLPDESLGGARSGIKREYREVKRKACVGELVKVVNAELTFGDYTNGAVFTATSVRDTGHVRDVVENSAVSLYLREYVVLEPSDIIRIGSDRFRMVDRKATVGERIFITYEGHYAKFEYVDVTRIDCDGDAIFDYEGEEHYARTEWYRVLEPVTNAPIAQTQPLSSRPATDQIAENIAALQAQNTALEARIKSLESRVSALERFNGEKTVIEAVLESAKNTYDSPRKKTAQQIRDEIVERAKADVTALQDDHGYYIVSYERLSRTCVVEFGINRKKRKVTAILRGSESGRTYAVGRAKCAPNDVFNAHIGRAIALRRALGLEVPAEYLSVPAPEKTRVGDVVICNVTNRDEYEIVPNFTAKFTELSLHYAKLALNRPDGIRIIDDSREGAESSASSALKGVAA